MREVERRSSGAVDAASRNALSRAGAAARKRAASGSSTSGPTRAHDDERRRYYQLTERGIAVARAEAERLASQLAAARARKLLRVRA